MKKIMSALAALSCIALVSSFSPSPVSDEEPSDYTYYHLLEPPVCDEPVSAYNCVARAPLDIVICPGSGVRCNVKLTLFGAQVTVNNEKGRGRYDVEVNGSGQ